MLYEPWGVDGIQILNFKTVVSQSVTRARKGTHVRTARCRFPELSRFSELIRIKPKRKFESVHLQSGYHTTIANEKEKQKWKKGKTGGKIFSMPRKLNHYCGLDSVDSHDSGSESGSTCFETWTKWPLASYRNLKNKNIKQQQKDSEWSRKPWKLYWLSAAMFQHGWF